MKNLIDYFSGSLIFILIFFSLINQACKKENSSYLESDSIVIAKILQPDQITGKDAFIESKSPDTNFGKLPVIPAFSWTDAGYFNTARSLIRFNLSSIPAGKKIKSARLSLFYASYLNLKEQTGENSFSIFKITQDWNENNVTWNSQPKTDSSDSIIVEKSKSVNQSYTDIDVTRFIQDMIDNPESNYGFMLKMNNELPYKLVILASSNDTDKNRRPRLVIYF